MKIYPNVPVVFQDSFPANFVNAVAGWGFTKEELEENRGKLLTLDIDFGNYCSLNCPHCFRRNNRVDIQSKKLMNYDDVLDVVKQGKKLGLRAVKFLGAGEPFEEKRLLEFLHALKELNVTPVIFTKGRVIGDDSLVKKYHSDFGVSTGEELVAELNKTNTSILLGFNSFDPELQDKMVGNVKGYTLTRNRALELLVEGGLTKSNPTRLCFAAVPITKESEGDLFEIYQWARMRNIYPVMCPPMVSGRCGETNWQQFLPPYKTLVQLYTNIYQFNIKHGIQTLQQIEDEGVSPYAGAHPCTQVSCGMYVTLSGVVLRCPGDDVSVFGSIWGDSLETIWKKSENYRRAGTFNCGCPPKAGKTIPNQLYADVLKNLKAMKMD
jgi:MoaA/NifB/PqqE/SkfB family radical SAM enzyme